MVKFSVLERFFVVLGQVSTLFFLMAVGYLLGKLGKITEAGTREMSTLLVYFATPCVIIDSFQTDWDAAKLHTLALGTAAMVGCFVIYILSGYLFFRKEEKDLQAPLRFGAIYANTGFMGLPLVGAVLGEEAMIYGVVAMVVFNAAIFTHGVAEMGGRKALSPARVIFSPGLVATAIGLPLFLTRTALPGPIGAGVRYIGNLNTPLAMVVIGAQMARADLLRTFREKKLYAATAVKLLLMPLLTALVLLPLKLDATFYIAAVILGGAPSAGLTSMLSEQYGRDVEHAAQLVSLSTLLSIFSLPVMTVLAEALAL